MDPILNITVAESKNNNKDNFQAPRNGTGNRNGNCVVCNYQKLL